MKLVYSRVVRTLILLIVVSSCVQTDQFGYSHRAGKQDKETQTDFDITLTDETGYVTTEVYQKNKDKETQTDFDKNPANDQTKDSTHTQTIDVELTTDASSSESNEETTETYNEPKKHSLETKYIILIVFGAVAVLILGSVLFALVLNKRLPRMRRRIRPATRVESNL